MDLKPTQSTGFTPTPSTTGSVTVNSPAPTPAPTPEHHFNLGQFLKILLAIAPAVSAPFIKSPGTTAIINAELPVAQALADALSQK